MRRRSATSPLSNCSWPSSRRMTMNQRWPGGLVTWRPPSTSTRYEPWRTRWTRRQTMLELRPAPPASAAPPSTILVVDDNPVNLQVLVRTLDGRGHRILAARNGRAALEIARRVQPDIVLLDVMMPDMGGFEVCKALKADPDMQETAVIFLSALGDVEDKVSGLSLGAVDYITKPIQPEEVQARVSNHLVRLYLERELRHS